MIDIVLVTEKACLVPDPNITYSSAAVKEDGLLMQAFEEGGLTCARIAWEDEDFDWSSTRVALLKTPWNYFRHIPEFTKWIDRIAQKCILVNDRSIVLWNMDKHYLLDLRDYGIAIPETHILDSGTNFDPDFWNGFLGNNGVVVKPFISGGAKDTFLLRKPWNAIDLTNARNAIRKQPMMVQPFIPSVVSQGEISLVFLNGKFTHAMRKAPKENDFRVQAYHGGSLQKYGPTQQEIEFGARVLDACYEILNETPLYARVDFCYGSKGELLLMELEAIEPELWYSYSPEAVDALVGAIRQLMTAQ